MWGWARWQSLKETKVLSDQSLLDRKKLWPLTLAPQQRPRRTGSPEHMPIALREKEEQGRGQWVLSSPW